MEKRYATLLVAFMGGWLLNAALPMKTVLENKKVKVVETTYLPGVPREPGVRQGDQVVVFLDECAYERKDPVTGELTIRKRKAGEVIWHDRGETSPQLTNQAKQAFRTLTIEMK